VILNYEMSNTKAKPTAKNPSKLKIRYAMDSDSPEFYRRCFGYEWDEEEGLILIIAEARLL
jgi:hypothetical protein